MGKGIWLAFSVGTENKKQIKNNIVTVFKGNWTEEKYDITNNQVGDSSQYLISTKKYPSTINYYRLKTFLITDIEP